MHADPTAGTRPGASAVSLTSQPTSTSNLRSDPGLPTVDVAGATSGGAARFRSELLAYVARKPTPAVNIVGLGRSVTAQWLLRRETMQRAATCRIATNNVGYCSGRRRIVLLRNALHFLRPEESGLASALNTRARAQVRIVHRMAARADLVVVPTHAMANRVITKIPQLRDRIEVRPHPLTLEAGNADPNVTRLARTGEGYLLCPMLPAAHKNAAELLGNLAVAVERTGMDLRLAVTADPRQLPPQLMGNPLIVAIGQQPVPAMSRWYSAARAVYFPTTTESFGYPLAEARVAGKSVLAVETEQNREVAGGALIGYASGSMESLCSALAKAVGTSSEPDPDAFDPTRYFDWLLELATS